MKAPKIPNAYRVPVSIAARYALMRAMPPNTMNRITEVASVKLDVVGNPPLLEPDVLEPMLAMLSAFTAGLGLTIKITSRVATCPRDCALRYGK